MNHFMFAFAPKSTGGGAPPAATPVFENAGTAATGGGVSSVAPALPASRTNGNLLIAFIGLASSGLSPTVSSGWTLGGTENGLSLTWAYRFVDGTEAAPTFSWGSNKTYVAQVIQFSGVKAATPIGNTTSGSSTGTTMSLAGVLTLAGNSLALAIMYHGGTGVPPLPTNYTSLGTVTNATMSFRIADEAVATAGSTSDNISVSVSSNVWAIWILEIRAN